jgi:hypothetical protein
LLRRIRFIQAYYLASPLFLALGWWWGTEIRVSFIPDLRLRFVYYVLLSGLGLLTHFRPSSAPWVALGESTLNLLLIMGWILLPLYSVMDAVDGGAVGVPYTVNQVLINGGLAGTFFLAGFYHAQAELVRRFPWLGGPTRRGPGVR